MAAPLETTAERDPASLEAFVAAYRPLPGIFDEMMDDGGRVRAHWRLTWIDVEAPHQALTVKLTARVSVDPLIEPDALATPTWETIREETFATGDIGPTSPAHFVFASRMVSLDPEIRGYAQASFEPGRPILDGAMELMRRLKSDIVYEIGATTVRSAAASVRISRIS